MTSDGPEQLTLGIEGELIDAEGELSLGVVGCGAHTYRNILPALRFVEGVSVDAVVDVNESKAEQYATEFGASRAYTDYRELMQADIDAVLVVVGFNPELGVPRYPNVVPDLLESDIPTWFEKPPAASRDALAPILDAASNNDVFFQVGFKMMYAPGIRKTAELIDRQSFGAIQSYRLSYAVDLPSSPKTTSSPAWRRFIDDIMHPLSVVVDLFGEPKVSVVEHSGTRDGLITLDHGAFSGSLHLTGGAREIGPAERLTVVGEGPLVEVRGGTEVTYHQDGAVGSYGRSSNFMRSDGSHSEVYTPDLREPLGALELKALARYGYISELRAFVDAVRTDSVPPRAGPADTKAVMNTYDEITAMLSSDPAREPLQLTEYFPCQNCHNRWARVKDGWSAACSPKTGGCGSTVQIAPFRNIEDISEIRDLARQMVTDHLEESVTSPTVEVWRSGGQREPGRTFIRCSSDNGGVVGKFTFSDDLHQIRHEYQVLTSRSLHPFTVPNVQQWIPDRGFVMTYYDGDPLRATLDSAVNSLVPYARDLAAFHERTTAFREPIDGSGPAVPHGMTHGDFDPFNVLVTDDHALVIDWEDSGIRPQVFDLLHFIVMTGVVWHDGGPEETASAIRKGEGRFGAFAAEMLDTYTSVRNLSRRTVLSAFPDYINRRLRRLSVQDRDVSSFVYPYLGNGGTVELGW